MADQHGCNNGMSDGASFSSPVPIIGLYIAGASVVCMLMMLWDIGAGIVAKKRWLPCKVFKLDSVTLTLLGVVAKIPVDLTSSMPNRYDQLSKLAGTVLICICMGFLMPSIGASNGSECFTNMAALSIFVITVAINICIQLRTGVIVLFFKEHIIILCLMLMLLGGLWDCSIKSRRYKISQAATYKDLVKTGNKSMFGRLKLCYLYCYSSDPYFLMCSNNIYASIIGLCLVCSIILMEATFRSVILKKLDFCSSRHSDYDWSMPLIVVIQNLTVIVGTLAILSRWLAISRGFMNILSLSPVLGDPDNAIQRYKILGELEGLLTWQKKIDVMFVKGESAAGLLDERIFSCLNTRKQDKLNFFDDLPHECDIVASEYIMVKSVDDIIKFRNVCCRVSLKKMLQLLPRTSAQQLYPRVNGYQAYFQQSFSHKRPNDRVEQKVCSLSVALLMKIAQICIPKDHLGSLLLCAYSEAKKIIHFIDKTLITRDLVYTFKLSFAKAMWQRGDFSCLIPDNILGIQPDLNRAVAIMETLKEKFHEDFICYEIEFMVDFINLQNCSSIEELSNFIKEMLAYMLHLLITQLPVAIHKSLSECPWEEFEERVKHALSFLFKMESAGALEDEINWLFPQASGISSFIADETPAPDSTGPLRRLREIYPYNS